jgi:hypothetical protein
MSLTGANRGREGIVSWTNLLRTVLAEMLSMIVERTYVSARFQTRGTFASPFQLSHPGREGGCHLSKLFRSDLAK